MVPKPVKHTVTFGYDLSDSIQTLPFVSYAGLRLDAENCGGAKCFDEVLDATPSANGACDEGLWLIP